MAHGLGQVDGERAAQDGLQGWEGADHTNCPGPAALPSHKLQAGSPATGHMVGSTRHEGPRGGMCGPGHSSGSVDTRLSLPHPWVLLEVWVWRGLLRASTRPSEGPLGHKQEGRQKTGTKPWLNLVLPLLTPGHPSTLHLPPSLSRQGGVVSSGKWFTGSCFSTLILQEFPRLSSSLIKLLSFTFSSA